MLSQSFNINRLVYWTQMNSTPLITFHLNNALLDHIRIMQIEHMAQACTAHQLIRL